MEGSRVGQGEYKGRSKGKGEGWGVQGQGQMLGQLKRREIKLSRARRAEIAAAFVWEFILIDL